MTIWGNCLVYNEENFVWFAINSVIDHLDKLIIWDTGSSDNTVKIIQEIIKKYPQKIEFKEVGKVSGDSYTEIRQQMLKSSSCDWIFILDGDEVWFDNSIKKLITQIKDSKEEEAFVVPFYNAVGDIYHHQEKLAGRYKLLGVTGHRTIKAINKKIMGLHWDLPYPHEGLFNKEGKLIQDSCLLKFVDAPFMHTSLLERSTLKPRKKSKLEIGQKFAKDFTYPQIFLKPYPEFISSPFKKMSGSDLIIASILTPLKKVKRKISK